MVVTFGSEKIAHKAANNYTDVKVTSRIKCCKSFKIYMTEKVKRSIFPTIFVRKFHFLSNFC